MWLLDAMTIVAPVAPWDRRSVASARRRGSGAAG